MATLRTRNHCLRGPLVLRFSLSYRDVEELLVERGLPADHTRIRRWVQRYAPELDKRGRRELKPTDGSWRVDETGSSENYTSSADECSGFVPSRTGVDPVFLWGWCGAGTGAYTVTPSFPKRRT